MCTRLGFGSVRIYAVRLKKCLIEPGLSQAHYINCSDIKIAIEPIFHKVGSLLYVRLVIGI
jgi:hypothetical protein